jgi:hypothetical protein
VEDGKVKMQVLQRLILAGTLAIGILCLPGAGQGIKAAAFDYSQARGSILKFEDVLNKTVNQAFGQLGVIGKVKGAYLPGYGYTFGFLVNTRWGLINTPFGAISSGADTTPEQKKQRLEALKDQLMMVMFSHGSGISPLERDKNLTITAYVEETSLEGTVSTTIILTVLKSDLDELSGKIERFNEFKQRVKKVEY